ncbi:MAG: hypothetical protein M5R36_28595 [Deltaproteobacteria bacterium]|nr:hypothetical protein [Deltaproteobacteria bacterium]
MLLILIFMIAEIILFSCSGREDSTSGNATEESVPDRSVGDDDSEISITDGDDEGDEDDDLEDSIGLFAIGHTINVDDFYHPREECYVYRLESEKLVRKIRRENCQLMSIWGSSPTDVYFAGLQTESALDDWWNADQYY